MWNPPIALTPAEQTIVARPRKTRKFCVFLREHRHELLDTGFQHLLAYSYRPELGGQEPVEAGLLAHGTVTCPGGQTVPMPLGSTVAFPARACDTCPQRAQRTTATLGHGRTLTIRVDEPCQQQLRATLRAKLGRAALRQRTAEKASQHLSALPAGHRSMTRVLV